MTVVPGDQLMQRVTAKQCNGFHVDAVRPQNDRRIAERVAQALTDGHAPALYRADTVRNLPAWYGAFDVKPGQKLYLAPKDRVEVW